MPKVVQDIVVSTYSGDKAPKELEASVIPHLLRPQLNVAPENETELGKLSPSSDVYTVRQILGSMRLQMNIPL